MHMKSKLAEQARLERLAINQSMTPEQRLEAFLAHNELMMELYLAGERMRAAERLTKLEGASDGLEKRPREP